MKESDRYKFCLSKMYEFIKDIDKSIEIHNNNYDEIFSNFEAKHSINMCLVQIGEIAY